MALNTLEGVKEIGGFKVDHSTKNGNGFELTGNDYILVDHTINAILFKIQNGPIKENGVTGCQVLTMIQTAKIMLEKLDEKYPCIENIISIHALNTAIKAQDERTKGRERRNVEGTSEI